MTLTHNRRILIAIVALLSSTLACRAATRLIIPDTPTPQPTFTATLSPTLVPTVLPTFTPTVLAFEASCPQVVSKIIDDAVYSQGDIHKNSDATDETLTYLVDYRVHGDELMFPHDHAVAKTLQTEMRDRTTQTEIWEYFTRLIPAERRDFISGFSIFTDGKENYLAAVNQSYADPKKWILNVDIADATPKTNLTYTLLHEYGHLLTLTSNQVTVSIPIYNHPDDKAIYQKEQAACPQYFTGEGCSNPDSYINTFFNRFWPDIYAEWQKIDQQDDEKTKDRMLHDFYHSYKDQFVTDYAPTSPSEDIAESFAFFILSPKPDDTSIASEKILFFYDYPELLQLRMTILGNICTEFQP